MRQLSKNDIHLVSAAWLKFWGIVLFLFQMSYTLGMFWLVVCELVENLGHEDGIFSV